jgi:hypothetical protein
MQTPDSRCRPSARRYDANPPRWEYPTGARVLKVDSQGKLTLAGKNWKISNALAGEWVQVMQLEQRLQVYYCRTLICEIELENARSKSVRDVLGRFVSHVLGLDTYLAYEWVWTTSECVGITATTSALPLRSADDKGTSPRAPTNQINGFKGNLQPVSITIHQNRTRTLVHEAKRTNAGQKVRVNNVAPKTGRSTGC